MRSRNLSLPSRTPVPLHKSVPDDGYSQIQKGICVSWVQGVSQQTVQPANFQTHNTDTPEQ